MFQLFCKAHTIYKTYENFRFIYYMKKTVSYTQYNIKSTDSNYYLYELYKSIENCKTGNSLFKLTNKALTYQIHDLYLWRLIEQKFYELQRELSAKEISSIINYFKQIKINDSKIYENSIDIILSSIDKYSIHDLSLICLSFTYFNKSNTNFMNKIADAIIKLYEREKDNIHKLTKKEIYKFLISYVHIIGSYSKIKHKNIDIFKIASLYIHCALNSDVNIPSKIILKIINSYANVKIKHSILFDSIVKQIPVIKITDEELKNIKDNFEKLKYSDETLDKYIQYRLF